MDNQKFTPGPWKVEHTFGEMIIQDSEGYPIATMTGEDSDNEAKANAYLIARAPELLQENERLKSEILVRDIQIVGLKSELEQIDQNDRMQAELEQSEKNYLSAKKDSYSAGLMCQRILDKDEIERQSEQIKKLEGLLKEVLLLFPQLDKYGNT